MLTLFTCPKPFQGYIDIIQKNAIQSWKNLDPNTEIILLGNEEGTVEIVKDLGLRQIPNIQTNKFGTPLINSLFEEAEKVATYRWMVYLNSDVILMSDFMKAVEKVIKEMPHSLMVGQRWNLRIFIDFKKDWEKRLITLLEKEGELSPPFSIDYFVFPKGIWGEIPPFTIGRPAWDNWMIYQAHSQGIPIVNLTKMVRVVHQKHDYTHHPQGWRGVMKGIEAKENISLAGNKARSYSILDAQYYLTPKGVRQKVAPYHRTFYLYQLLVRYSDSHPYLRGIINLIKRVGDRFSHPPMIK